MPPARGERKVLWGLVLVLLLSSAPARADIPPDEPPTLPDTSCLGKSAGAACTGGGVCESVRVRRPQLVAGAATPSWGWTEVMVCRPPAPTFNARWLLLLFLLLVPVALRRQRPRGAMGMKPLVLRT